MRTNRIVHYISPGPDSLDRVLRELLGLSESRSRELFDLGSLYLNKERIYDPGTRLREGDYVRIHSEPKRYERPSDLKDRALLETELWWLVDKPAGIPCHPTVDNGKENLQVWMSDILKESLHITHRLDVPTSGCLVLAKGPEGVRAFNKLLINRRVQKTYEALVEGDFRHQGLLTHWMKRSNWAPREVSATEDPEGLLCQLEILESEFLGNCTRLVIRLVTGRTHQIRAQMQAVGHPILNDVMYGAQKYLDQEAIALKACRLQIEQAPGDVMNFEVPADWSSWTKLTSLQ